MPGPTGKSLTLDLLSTLRGGSMPIAALVAAGEVFGLGEGSIRVAVTRLLAAGQIERDERGRYRLGPAVAVAGAAALRSSIAGGRQARCDKITGHSRNQCPLTVID